ncbi:MAG: class I SAM-dependent methyltransferase [Acidimicrobiales bacterium]|nr:class I SAM-dependent methyltransferase [Acidimicrobiales bacterium]
MDDWRELNRRAWDERVPIHLSSEFYDNDSFRAGRCSLRDFELDEVGDVAGKLLLHLQCHFGQDTLSWARRGATVTGLDFSAPAIEAARDLARDCGLDAEFVVADVYDAVGALGGRQFDIVYTGLGAIVWLPDIERWAQVCASLVKPGGFLYFVEFHPIANVFYDDSLSVGFPYFEPEGNRWDDSGTYTDPDAPTEHNVTWQWTHPLGSVVSAVAATGLRIEFLHEWDHTLFARWPFLERREDRTYHLPPGVPSLPLMYSMKATKTASSEVGVVLGPQRRGDH